MRVLRLVGLVPNAQAEFMADIESRQRCTAAARRCSKVQRAGLDRGRRQAAKETEADRPPEGRQTGQTSWRGSRKSVERSGAISPRPVSYTGSADVASDLFCNRLGDVERGKKPKIWDTVDVPGGPDPAARFVFKYRSLGEPAATKIRNSRGTSTDKLQKV